MKLKLFPKFRHLKHHLLFQNTLIICFIIGFTAIITYTISIQIQIKEAVRYNSVMVTQISKSIDSMFESYNRVMDGVTFNNNIQRLLKEEYKDEKEKLLINKEMAFTISTETLMSNEVDLIYLYDLESLRVNQTRSVKKHNYQSMNILRTEIYDQTGKVTWGVMDDGIFANRMIYGIHSYYLEVIGYLTMSIEKSSLQERIQKFDPTEERHIIIIDEEDNVVLSNSDQKELLAGLEHNTMVSGAFVDNPIYGKMLMNKFQNDLTGWKIISLVSLNEISKGPMLIGRAVFVIGVVAIIIGITFIWLSINYIVKPLNKLSLVMDEVEKDNFYAQIQIDRDDELGRVGDSFNRMMKKINALISDIYEKEINEKDAQLRALRAQINPHFLYNSLDAINWMAQFGKTDEVSKMTVSLSRLLKSSISNTREFISLEEEIKYINDYMTIQQIRFQEKIHFSINIDQEAKDCLVPKLILQPIVENAMIHGLEKNIKQGYLFINGTIKENKLQIQIIDNGAGMNEYTVLQLTKAKYVPIDEKKGTGNGILNVQNRIRLLFGKDYGITIESNANVGTLFQLLLPVQKEADKSV